LTPNARSEDARTWGPAGSSVPGYLVRLVMQRPAVDRFTYQVELLPAGGGAPVPVLSGEFVPSGALRRGRGTFFIPFGALRVAAIQTPGFEEIDRFDVAYDTQGEPHTVDMVFTAVSTSPFDGLEYHYRVHADGRGRLDFVLK